MHVDRLDHLVLTVRSIQVTCDFYTRTLGLEVVKFGNDRIALRFGQQKINLHEAGKEFEPKAQHPTPGAADLCFVTTLPLENAIVHLQSCEVKLLGEAVERTGAIGLLRSIYFRDPDGNLIELSNYLQVIVSEPYSQAQQQIDIGR